jgi:hypothetical protein
MLPSIAIPAPFKNPFSSAAAKRIAVAPPSWTGIRARYVEVVSEVRW